MASPQEPFDDQGVPSGAGSCTTTNSCLENYQSPYHSQFEELSEIAFGGFGTVVRAQHKLDQAIYAVKKVSIEEKYRDKIVNEVRIMARLYHSNIVDYKQSWIERYNGTEFLNSLPSSIDSLDAAVESLRLNAEASEEHGKVLDNGEASSSHEMELRYVLYIQMKLHEQNLRQWMEERKDYSTSLEIKSIAIQILRGLEHMHTRGIIHHDIKPDNIFISSGSGEISIQLGDFGLACSSQQGQHTEEIGTALYIAPEQAEKKCDPKSDIYSFGIVLLELLCPMKTAHEKTLITKEAKNKKLPARIMHRYPDWIPIVRKALREDPNKRPTAANLLDTIKNSEARSRLQEEVAEARLFFIRAWRQ